MQFRVAEFESGIDILSNEASLPKLRRVLDSDSTTLKSKNEKTTYFEKVNIFMVKVDICPKSVNGCPIGLSESDLQRKNSALRHKGKRLQPKYLRNVKQIL